jgi:hypothetical protein
MVRLPLLIVFLHPSFLSMRLLSLTLAHTGRLTRAGSRTRCSTPRRRTRSVVPLSVSLPRFKELTLTRSRTRTVRFYLPSPILLFVSGSDHTCIYSSRQGHPRNLLNASFPLPTILLSPLRTSRTEQSPPPFSPLDTALHRRTHPVAFVDSPFLFRSCRFRSLAKFEFCAVLLTIEARSPSASSLSEESCSSPFPWSSRRRCLREGSLIHFDDSPTLEGKKKRKLLSACPLFFRCDDEESEAAKHQYICNCTQANRGSSTTLKTKLRNGGSPARKRLARAHSGRRDATASRQRSQSATPRTRRVTDAGEGEEGSGKLSKRDAAKNEKNGEGYLSRLIDRADDDGRVPSLA